MTEIHCVPAAQLTDRCLRAEMIELPRGFDLMRRDQAKGNPPGFMAPDEFVIGTGNVRFFSDKGLFLARRQMELIQEFHRRGKEWRGFTKVIKPEDGLVDGIKAERMNDWEPDEKALAKSRLRLFERDPTGTAKMRNMPAEELAKILKGDLT